MISDFYKDKVVLLTGATGFLGKVILYKFLKDVPTVKRIYVLVRQKRGTTIAERMMKEVFQSPCFDQARELPHFKDMIQNKIIPIQGDINKEGLAMQPEDRALLQRELQVLINCAASVDFNEAIADAININYLGCMRMLELAHQCERLLVFTHVSTAYVNCEKFGFIKEQIYDIEVDSDDLIQKILQMSKKE